MTENVEEKKGEEPVKNPLEKSVNFTVSAAELTAGIEAALKRKAKKAKIAGFRPGHVPFETVRAMYGQDAYIDTLNELIAREFEKAAKEAKLLMVGRPTIQAEEGKEGTDLKFIGTVECYPEFDLPSFEGLELKRYVCPVTEVEVAKTIDIMLKQRVKYVLEEGHKAVDGDRITLNFKGTNKEGVAFEGGSADGFLLVLGQGRMLPDFEKPLLGMAQGEKKTFELTFPADYPAKELAGKPVDFAVEITKVEKAVLPALDDTFAKSVGTKDLATLNADVRRNLDREVAARLQARTKDEVMDAIAGLTNFALPRAMVEDEQHTLAEQSKKELAQYGMDAKKMPSLPLDIFKDRAEKRVRLGILVNKIVQVEKLTAEIKDVEELAENIAASYEKPEEMKQWILKDGQRVSNLAGVALENKIVEFVLGKAKTSEETLAFDKLMAR